MRLLLYFFVILAVLSCVDRGFTRNRYYDSTSRFTADDKTFSGMCSYYGKKFHGKKTASGDLFDMYAFTAAHRTLPFGTKLEVENTENNKKVIVTVNDRGPFVRERILDISYAAADALGMLKTGTAEIHARVLSIP